MRILADFHHGQLYRSHVLTFNKRLGHELYRPIGRTWHTHGYWYWITDDHQISQMLGHPLILTQPYPNGLDGKGIGSFPHPHFPIFNQPMITYEVFMDMQFDVMIASLPPHLPIFQKISEQHPSHPKVIFQMGNNWTEYPREAKNILNATNIEIEPHIHTLNYYPEFEVSLCRQDIDPTDKSISTFVGANAYHSHDLFMEVEKELGWVCKEYGAGNRDGIIMDSDECVIEKILESQFVWHVKKLGDGYGFITHEAFACGRPILVNFKDTYYWQRAGRLMSPGVNCIDVCDKSAKQIAQDVLDAKMRWNDMSLAAKTSFDSVVNFENEGKRLQKFLEDLVP